MMLCTSENSRRASGVGCSRPRTRSNISMRSRLSAVASMRLTAGGETHSMRAAPLSVPAIMMA